MAHRATSCQCFNARPDPLRAAWLLPRPTLVHRPDVIHRKRLIRPIGALVVTPRCRQPVDVVHRALAFEKRPEAQTVDQPP
jgi:hypothetical protein